MVTEPLRSLSLVPEGTTVLVCGPERMIRFAVVDLLDKGMAPGDIRVSLERNMQCEIG